MNIENCIDRWPLKFLLIQDYIDLVVINKILYLCTNYNTLGLKKNLNSEGFISHKREDLEGSGSRLSK